MILCASPIRWSARSFVSFFSLIASTFFTKAYLAKPALKTRSWSLYVFFRVQPRSPLNAQNVARNDCGRMTYVHKAR